MRERWTSLISGGGTTMTEMAKACLSGEVSMYIACVVASKKSAGGIEKARALGIPEKDIVVVNPHKFLQRDGEVDQEAFGLELRRVLRDHGATVVTQNGWMPKTPELVIDEFPDTMFNQHPGPVPEFGGEGMYGRRVHAALLLFRRMTKGDQWTEAIAQRVHREYDQGAVVKSERVALLPEDTVDALQQRVLPVEHRVQIELLKDIARGNVKEITRTSPLIADGKEHDLLLAKRLGKMLYPKG